jgi:hypothetical protein
VITSACRTIGTSTWTAVAATASREQHDVVAFKAGEICGEKLASGHDDHIEAGIGLVASEQLAGEALGPVADNGPSELSRRGDAESRPTRSRGGGLASQHEHRHEATVPLGSVRVNVLEVGAPPDPLMWLETLGHAKPWRAGRDHVDATTPSDASGPWRDGASGPGVHSSCSCVRESHASCGGGCDWAEKCASWITRLTVTGRGRTAEPLMVDVAPKSVNKAGCENPVVSSSAHLLEGRARRRVAHALRHQRRQGSQPVFHNCGKFCGKFGPFRTGRHEKPCGA